MQPQAGRFTVQSAVNAKASSPLQRVYCWVLIKLDRIEERALQDVAAVHNPQQKKVDAPQRIPSRLRFPRAIEAIDASPGGAMEGSRASEEFCSQI